MTKLLQNKSIIKFLGIALSILLIVALVPQINIAYGSKDDVLADTGTEETTDTPRQKARRVTTWIRPTMQKGQKRFRKGICLRAESPTKCRLLRMSLPLARLLLPLCLFPTARMRR